ncbi:MAG TPA: TrkH family potassium uptake protein [Nitrospinota bacterium]|nr:TrkH family potassium uptake protein [Nitrospinota bacterium]
MNIRLVVYVLGIVIVGVGLSMLLPIAISLYYQDGDLFSLVYSSMICIFLGLIVSYSSKEEGDIGIKDGFAIVTFGWISAALFGSLPFLFFGTFNNFTDAFFEAMSGFTTTGATVLANIEKQPHGILVWRSLTQWLGGMGIIVLSIAILPALRVGGMQLFKAEVPGPSQDRLTPRIKDTARLLWMVYVIISATETLLLLLGGMSLFDALNHTFTTMATGGFSTKDASIGAFNSPYFDAVITLFMFMAGINFALHYQMLKGNLKSFFKDTEFLFYLGVVGFFITLVVINLKFSAQKPLTDAIRYGSFQVVSIVTTTGYGTADFELWPQFSQYTLLLLMFIGGCAGSTGGSIKNIRILLLIKYAYYELYKLIHPRAIISIKIRDKMVSEDILQGVLGFFLLYMAVFVVSSLFMALLGLDMITAISSVAATIGNVGPGLGMVGPTDNYAHIPFLGKWLLSLCMLIGRLEIYTVLIFFIPEFWKK